MNAVNEDSLTTILAAFRDAGGRFVVPIEEMALKLGNCRALIFDWDGVFNAGRKGQAAASDFAEADSMGTNMLRYGLWRKLGALPYTAIVSGEDNESAINFARREHFTEVYTGVQDKRHITERVCGREGLNPQQIACVFDDINDLPMAEMCGLRLMVRRTASPLLAEYVARRSLCDYVSGAASGNYAVREICELLLGLLGNYETVLDSRVAFDGEYQTYLQNRQNVVTGMFGKGGPEKPE